MSQSSACPYCGCLVNNDPAFAGRRVQCPGCRQLFQMPGIYAAPVGPPGTPRKGFPVWAWVLCGGAVALALCCGVGQIVTPRDDQDVAPIDEAVEHVDEPAQAVDDPDEPVEAKRSGRATMADYQRIRNGMSRAEVEDILGPGEEMSSNVVMAGTEYEVQTVMCSWSGFGWSVNVTLQNDKVMSKAQFGL